MYVSISPPQHTKIGPHCCLVIYGDFNSPSIIRYLEPLTNDLFIACYAYCHFDETNFLSLGNGKPLEVRREFSWKVFTLSYLDPRTSQCEIEVRRIVHLWQIANQLLDAFTDVVKVTKLYVLTINTLARVVVPAKQLSVKAANECSVTCQKCGRPLSSIDSAPQKRGIKD